MRRGSNSTSSSNSSTSTAAFASDVSSTEPFPGVPLRSGDVRRVIVEPFPGIPARSPFSSPLASRRCVLPLENTLSVFFFFNQTKQTGCGALSWSSTSEWIKLSF